MRPAWSVWGERRTKADPDLQPGLRARTRNRDQLVAVTGRAGR